MAQKIMTPWGAITGIPTEDDRSAAGFNQPQRIMDMRSGAPVGAPLDPSYFRPYYDREEAPPQNSPYQDLVAGAQNPAPAPDAQAAAMGHGQEPLKQNIHMADVEDVPTNLPLGAKQQAKLSEDQKRLQQTQKALSWSPEEYQQMLDLSEGIDPKTKVANPEHPYQVQKQGLLDLERDFKNQQAQDPTLDISPLFALASPEVGGSLSRSYQRPENDQEKRDRIYKIASDIQKRKEELSQRAVEGVKTLKAGSQNDLFQSMIQAGLIKGFELPKPTNPRGSLTNTPFRALEQDFLNKDRGVGKYVDSFDSVLRSANELDLNNTTSIEMLKRSLLNLGGDTRPSDRDVAAFGGDSRLLERAKQFWDSKAASGGLTGLNQDEIRALLRGLSAVAVNRYKEKLTGTVKNAKRKFPALSGYSDDEIKAHLMNASGLDDAKLNSLLSTGGKGSGAGASPNPAPSGGGKMMSPDEFFKQKGK